jgi:hypothetical protein
MKIKKLFVRILIVAALGLCAGIAMEYSTAGLKFPIFLIVAIIAGIFIELVIEILRGALTIAREDLRKLKKTVLRILIATSIGLLAGIILDFVAIWEAFPFFSILGIFLGTAFGIAIEIIQYHHSMRKAFLEGKGLALERLPVSTADLIRQIIKKMRYRKEVRSEVMAELAAHFEDQLQDCKTDEEKQERARQLIDDFGDVKLLAVLLRRAKKRCRPLWRTVVARSFQTIGVLILCFIFYCVYISLGEPTISVNYVREMTNLTRPVVNESRNAAPLYQKAFDLYKEPLEVELKEEPVFADDNKLFNAIRNKQWVDELNAEELASLKTWIFSNTEAIKLFKQATEKPYCWWERQKDGELLLNVLLPELSPFRNFSRLLSWKAALEANSGNIEEAFNELLVCYQAGQHLEGPRFLVEQLVGWALQAKSVGTAFIILQHRQVEGPLLKDFQAKLENLMAKGIYTPDYTVERFWALDFIQRCYTDNGCGTGHMIPRRLSIISSSDSDIMNDFENPVLNYGQFLAISLVTADRDKMRQMFENYYDNAQRWAHETPWRLHQEDVDFEMGFYDWSRLKQIRYWPIIVFMPATGRITEIAYRYKLQAEALITVTALYRYRQDTGQYPDDLDELVRNGYLKKLPMDYFSDKPLVYKKTDDNFLLYSYGPDCTDNDGTPAYYDDGRYQMWSNKDADAIFWPVPEPKIITAPPPYSPEMVMPRY